MWFEARNNNETSFHLLETLLSEEGSEFCPHLASFVMTFSKGLVYRIQFFFPVSNHLLTCPRKRYRHADHFVENQICFSASLSVDMNFKLHFILYYQKLPHMISSVTPTLVILRMIRRACLFHTLRVVSFMFLT